MEIKPFGTQLKRLRKAANITQEGFAEMLNIHVQTVSRWERGASQPDISLLGNIAEALGVSLERLAGVEEKQNFNGVFDMQRLGRTINSLRRDAGENQKELAALTSVPPDTVSKWERGKICPSLDLLIIIAEHYNVSLSQLYFGVEIKNLGAGPSGATTGHRNKYNLLISGIALILVVIIALGAYFIFGYHKHSFGEWQILTEATCTAEGEEQRKCSGCNDTESRTIPATGHNIITVKGQPPTCLTSGCSDGRVCKHCGEIFYAQQLLPALGHDVSEWEIIREATTTSEGLMIKRCLRCNDILRQKIIPIIE